MRAIAVLILCFFLSSCISKKKYLEEVSSLTNQHQIESDSLSVKLKEAREEIRSLQLQLAERKGENNNGTRCLPEMGPDLGRPLALSNYVLGKQLW